MFFSLGEIVLTALVAVLALKPEEIIQVTKKMETLYQKIKIKVMIFMRNNIIK